MLATQAAIAEKETQDKIDKTCRFILHCFAQDAQKIIPDLDELCKQKNKVAVIDCVPFNSKFQFTIKRINMFDHNRFHSSGIINRLLTSKANALAFLDLQGFLLIIKLDQRIVLGQVKSDDDKLFFRI